LYSLLKENEVLIRIGAYQKGSDPELDEALEKKPLMEEFLKQDLLEKWDFYKTREQLQVIMS
ncbi:MAG: EscN/YscN/HrcN family type III secretion system ATPase, partial [Helicobacter sp.]|nr:EscN/YscN/HrcN family type III secretion system ATPase [Helicobacter sp.]MDY5740147.1 EscN/YscN/HrcN family type III secretion system ATPase [Helicobacter sp.]